jgi:uncharacterized protein YcbK (DUF882 family)
MREKISKNFTWSELCCPCGQCKPVIDQDHIDKLQALRAEFGKPMIVTSWYRCLAYNEKLVAYGQAVSNSQHFLGKATDISIVGWRPSDRYRLLNFATRFGFSGIGIYLDFIHLDTREQDLTFWLGC